MARRKLTEAQRVAARKTELGAERWRRKLAIMAGKQAPRLYQEHLVLVGDVLKDDIVFPEPETRPFIAAVDAFQSTGPVQPLVVIRDEQREDHYYPGGKTVQVLRETKDEPDIEVVGDRPPWEIDEDDDD